MRLAGFTDGAIGIEIFNVAKTGYSLRFPASTASLQIHDSNITKATILFSSVRTKPSEHKNPEIIDIRIEPVYPRYMCAISNPPARPFCDQFLADYSKDHVAYEITMFFKTQAAFVNNGIVPTSQNLQQRQFLSNLLTESYASHLRNLIDFLYPRGGKPQPSDIVAEDYCTVGIWVATAPTISPLLKESRKRADKEVAHLTTSRISGTPTHKHWNDLQHVAEIKTLLNLFQKTADPKRLDPIINDLISSL